jgi:hypothetical protein
VVSMNSELNQKIDGRRKIGLKMTSTIPITSLASKFEGVESRRRNLHTAGTPRSKAKLYSFTTAFVTKIDQSYCFSFFPPGDCGHVWMVSNQPPLQPSHRQPPSGCLGAQASKCFPLTGKDFCGKKR